MNKYQININDQNFEVTLLKHNDDYLKFEVAGKIYETTISPIIEERKAATNFAQEALSQAVAPLKQTKSFSHDLVAPMPGFIVAINVKEGQEISAGQNLLVIEAMKMENNITASRNCKIKKIHVSVGQEVKNAQMLISFD